MAAGHSSKTDSSETATRQTFTTQNTRFDGSPRRAHPAVDVTQLGGVPQHPAGNSINIGRSQLCQTPRFNISVCTSWKLIGPSHRPRVLSDVVDRSALYQILSGRCLSPVPDSCRKQVKHPGVAYVRNPTSQQARTATVREALWGHKLKRLRQGPRARSYPIASPSLALHFL